MNRRNYRASYFKDEISGPEQYHQGVHSPILRVMGIFSGVTRTDVRCSYPASFERHFNELIHILADEHIRVEKYNALQDRVRHKVSKTTFVCTHFVLSQVKCTRVQIRDKCNLSSAS